MKSGPKRNQDFTQSCAKVGKKLRLQPAGYFRQDGVVEVPAEPGTEGDKNAAAALWSSRV